MSDRALLQAARDWIVAATPLHYSLIARLDAALAEPNDSATRGAGVETTWLVERTIIAGQPRWLAWRDLDSPEWVTDAAKADRYSKWAAIREARWISKSGLACTATEHQFIGRAEPAGAEPEAVERVAKAIQAADDPVYRWEEMARYEPLARAALAVLREGRDE